MIRMAALASDSRGHGGGVPRNLLGFMFLPLPLPKKPISEGCLKLQKVGAELLSSQHNNDINHIRRAAQFYS